MRSLTLLSILVASYLATPVVHYENNLARRASNRMEDIIEANAGVDVDGEDRHHHYNYGLLDNLSLARLVRYILHLLGLYSDYDFEDNYELLGFLVNKGKITEEQADQVGDYDILGLLRGSRSHGLLSKLINLNTAVASDQDIADQKREMTEDSDDVVDTTLTILDGDNDPVDVDADIDADVDADVDADADADIDV